MSILNSVASWFMKKRMYQIEMFIKHPIETQMEVFHKLVRHSENTIFGHDFGFKDIQTIADFQNQIPISSYEQLFPYLDRVLKGEENVIWPGGIHWFSKSSGTTNDKSKFIPITKESLDDCHFKAGKDMLAIYLHNNPESKIFTGKGVPIAGSHEINKLNHNSYYGDLSAVLTQNTPLIFNLFRATSKKMALIGEWEEKINAMAQQLLDTNITTMAGVPTWTLVLINRIFELSNVKTNNLLDIWPNLEVFFHGGISFKPYRQQFEEIIPSSDMTYFETYNASEGFFGLQNDQSDPSMLLMLDYGIFYEFIPMDELHRDQPKAYTLGEVETNQTYAMVISTNCGLWRYLIGDTIQFTSIDPFKIKIVGRTKHFINAFGEELMIDNAESALKKAADTHQAELSNYTAAPFFLGREQHGGHEWVIEFKKVPANLTAFRESLDQELKNLNSDYEAKRYQNMVMKMPIIHAVRPGTFYQWMKTRGKLGGQNKVPRLCNHRKYLDSILEILPKDLA